MNWVLVRSLKQVGVNQLGDMKHSAFLKRLWVKCLAASLCLMLASCTTPPAWTEFHGTGKNQGFLLTTTSPARMARWQVKAGPMLYSSPAVAADGTVYVGTLDGHLVGARSGAIQRQNPLTGQLSSPAIGPNGTVYVSTILDLGNNQFSSQLFALTPLANSAAFNLKWQKPFPDAAYTTASPKVYSFGSNEYIFLPVHSDNGQELFVFDQQGNIIFREGLCNEVVGGDAGLTDLLAGLVAALTGGLSLIGWRPEFSPGGLNLTYAGPRDPSVALVDEPALTDPGNPIVVVAPNGCVLQAFRWESNSRKLTRLWTRNDRAELYSSPVITQDEFYIGKDKEVKSYDLRTGDERWAFDARDWVQSTPAVLINQHIAFVVAGSFAYRLDDGIVTKAFSFSQNTTASSPAISAKYLYISTSNGIYTFDFDLGQIAKDSQGPSGSIQGGFSSIAIDNSGDVYAASVDGWLYAFPK